MGSNPFNLEIILDGLHSGKKDSHSHGMVVFPSEVSLLLVSHSSCLWVRIRKQLTHYVGCDKYCYNGCPSLLHYSYPSAKFRLMGTVKEIRLNCNVED